MERRWTDKQRNILDFTISSLLRRKGRNLALLFVYTLVVFVLASAMIFTHALRRQASLVLEGTPAMVVQRMVAGRHDLIPVRYADTIGTIRGVRSVSSRLWAYYFDPLLGANYTVMVSRGRGPLQGGLVIGNGISRGLGLHRGDFMTFRTSRGESLSLEVTDVFSSRSELVSADLMLVSPEDFQTLFGMPRDLATDLVVDVTNPRELTTVGAKIARLLPDTRPILRDEILRTYHSIFDWRSGLIIVLLSGALLAFIIFAWDRASGLSAEERREIGILKAIGWETADVITLKFWEGVVVSLSSCLAGIALAYIHVFFASAPLFEHALKGWAVLYPDFRLTPSIDPYQIATIVCLAVVPYTVATIVPSWRAATVDPDSIMRS